jgi:hypothetical protein
MLLLSTAQNTSAAGFIPNKKSVSFFLAFVKRNLSMKHLSTGAGCAALRV